MRDDDRNTNTGTSELKAVASEALQIGKRYAQGARKWINQRRNEMAQRDRDQQQHDDERQRPQQSNWQEDHSQHARRSSQGGSDNPGWSGGGSGGSIDPGSRSRDYGERPHYRHGSEDREQVYGGRYEGAQSGQPMSPQWGGARGEQAGRYGDRDWDLDEQHASQRAGRYTSQRSGEQGRWYGENEQDGRNLQQREYPRGGRSDLLQAQGGGSQDQWRGSQGAGYGAHGRGVESGQAEHWGQGRQGGQDQRAGASQGSHRGRGPKGYSRSDERITEDLCEKLCDDELVDASDITVEVRQGVAVLTGSVEQRWMKHRIEDLAERCSGVKDVDNQVRVQRSQADERATAQQSAQGSGASTGSMPGGSAPSQQRRQPGQESSATDQSSLASPPPGNGSDGGRRQAGKGGVESSPGKQDS